MKFLAKSILNKEQLDAKIAVGGEDTHFELQLLHELDDHRAVWQDLDLNLLDGYTFETVHSPLYQYCPQLEDLLSNKSHILFKTFELADVIGCRQKCGIPVIIHSNMSFDIIERFPDIGMRLASQVGKALTMYPHIAIAIENVVTFSRCESGSMNYTLSNNIMFDNVKMAEWLNAVLQTSRVGTTLDVCHARMTEMFYREALKAAELPSVHLALDTYFSMNSGMCKVVHLADVKGSGYGKGKHGMPFEETERSLNALELALRLYKKYGYHTPITLEVAEEDYNNPTGYQKSLELAKDVWSKSCLGVVTMSLS